MLDPFEHSVGLCWTTSDGIWLVQPSLSTSSNNILLEEACLSCLFIFLGDAGLR